MRRMLLVPLGLLGLLALAAPGRAGCWCGSLFGGCCPPCKPIPCEPPCDLGPPCEHRMNLVICDKSEEYIATLRSIGCVGTAGCPTCGDGGCGCDGSNCCERIKAAEKLGSRFCADFCCNPEVLGALICALQSDPCWEVRRAAAWSMMSQDARVEDAVLALYIASKVDPHYMVRVRAAEALDILTRCCKHCYAELFKVGDAIAVELKAKKYKPGMENGAVVVLEAYNAGRLAYQKAAEEAARKAAEDAAKKAAEGMIGAPIPVAPVPVNPMPPLNPKPPVKPEAAPRPLPVSP